MTDYQMRLFDRYDISVEFERHMGCVTRGSLNQPVGQPGIKIPPSAGPESAAQNPLSRPWLATRQALGQRIEESLNGRATLLASFFWRSKASATVLSNSSPQS